MLHALLQELVYDSITEGAVWPFDRGYIRPPHFHGQLECLLVTRGTATLCLGTSAARVRAGQICWVLPGVPHVMSDFSPDFDMWVIQFDAALVEAAWREATGARDRAPGTSDESAADGGPFESWSVPLGERLAGRAIVGAGSDELRRLSELALSVWTSARPEQARQWLRALATFALQVTLSNLDRRRDLSIAALASCLLLSAPTTDRRAAAAELGVSEGFLSRRVHDDLGVTFVEHRARTRVVHFLALARQGNLNLLAAALDAGFGSYSQFHRTFTRVSGSRPRDYLGVGRRRSSLLIAGDRQQPQAGSVVALPDDMRQPSPL